MSKADVIEIEGTVVEKLQQEVNIGRRFNSPFVNLCRNSFPSSIIVRSAVKEVSNT